MSASTEFCLVTTLYKALAERLVAAVITLEVEVEVGVVAVDAEMLRIVVEVVVAATLEVEVEMLCAVMTGLLLRKS